MPRYSQDQHPFFCASKFTSRCDEGKITPKVAEDLCRYCNVQDNATTHHIHLKISYINSIHVIFSDSSCTYMLPSISNGNWTWAHEGERKGGRERQENGKWPSCDRNQTPVVKTMRTAGEVSSRQIRNQSSFWQHNPSKIPIASEIALASLRITFDLRWRSTGRRRERRKETKIKKWGRGEGHHRIKRGAIGSERGWEKGK